MKKEKVYRYSLQFPGKTDEQIRVGELLEQLGSRKSRLIIRAVSEYIETHPDETAAFTLTRSAPPSAYSREELRTLLTEILAENGYIRKDSSATVSPPPASDSTDDNTGDMGVEDLLDNLGVFLT
jgi:hypothetical protein